jgi:hypothetical protein|tara:strand:+ start:1860 stop:3839 length:1980 start_codon:yes stop_codon:yes gene_type:complete
MTLSTKFTLEQDQFISDLPINIEYYLTHLGAPTGCGKTTFVIEELAKKSKVLMLCPVNVQVAQLAHDFKDDPRVQCLTANDTSNSLDADVIVCVYDKLQQLLDSGVHFSEYTLVIDEAHKIYQAASYRESALTPILNAIDDHTFKQVITISATFQRDIFPLEFNEQIEILHRNKSQPKAEVHFYKNRTSLEESLLTIYPTDGKVAIIRLNDKEAIKQMKVGFEMQDMRVLEIHSDNQKSSEVIQFLETSHIADYDIVLCTSLLDEAINIKNNNIEMVHIFGKLHCDEIKQFIGRCRKSSPKFCLHLLNFELNRVQIEISEERKNLESLCHSALTFCTDLNKLGTPMSSAVSKVNYTVECHQRFSPIRYDSRDNLPPSINDIALLAKLYTATMEAQYQNDHTLNKALIGINCFESVKFFDTNTDEHRDLVCEILAQVSEAQENTRNLAIADYLAAADCTENDVTNLTTSVINELAEEHQQSGPISGIAQSMLKLSLILPPDQALDAIKQIREQQVLAFAHSVQKRLDIIPIMDALKEDLKRDGKVALNGQEAIEKYFLEAYRQFAKKNSEFKNFIGKLNITGLGVQKNNKFKITSRYIYAMIREFTVCEEKRSGGKQSFIISKIGAFGYDYNIRSIKTSTRAKILRKSQVNVTPEVDPIP